MAAGEAATRRRARLARRPHKVDECDNLFTNFGGRGIAPVPHFGRRPCGHTGLAPGGKRLVSIAPGSRRGASARP